MLDGGRDPAWGRGSFGGFDAHSLVGGSPLHC